MSYSIYIDVSLDIKPEYLEQYDIKLIPMHIQIGEEESMFDHIMTDEELKTFYKRIADGEVAKTSQITPNHYEEIFSEVLKEGKDILYISLSSGLSNTYSSSMLAAQNLMEDYPDRKIEIVDSLAATGGMGLMALLAARNREAGMSVTENAEMIRKNVLNVTHWFMVEDLMFLKRGGRISATTAIVGSALNVKPVLTIKDDGKLESISKQGGTNKTLKYLGDLYEKSVDRTLGDDVIIAHADCIDKAETLKNRVLEVTPDAKVQICMLSPIIGSHVGPGMVAITHFGGRNYT